MVNYIKKNFGNRVETLLECLKQDLYSKTRSPFARKLVVVPSPAMKLWLMIELAKDERIGISAGIEVVYLDSLVGRVAEHKKEPSILELSLRIETEIPKLMAKQQDLSKYLGQATQKSEKRRVALSETLAILFKKYEMFGQKMLEEWMALEDDFDWQIELWKNVVGKVDEKVSILSKNIQIYLFSLSFIPKRQYRILEEMSSLCEINAYNLSPCQAFWGDLESDKESRRLIKYFEQKNVKESQQFALESLLFDRNRLLANFGRMGREMAELTEDHSGEACEIYSLPSWVDSHPEYQDHLIEGSFYNSPKITLLSAVQSDLLFLRNPTHYPKIAIEDDNSIQINCASSAVREVQILYNSLMELFKNDKDLTPGDILVMAPDISKYEPYIRSTFEGEIDYQIMDLPLFSTSPLVQGFLYLIALPETRWDAGSLLRLFDYEPFNKKFRFSSEEIHRIKMWTKDAGILWGEDSAHRAELLKKSHCSQGMVDDTAIGTWEYGFDRLLHGLVSTSVEDPEAVEPIEYIELSQGELLGKWISIVKSLRNDLKCFANGTRYRLSDWSRYLECVLEAYFSVTNQSDCKEQLLDHIKSFQNINNQDLYSFVSIKHHLESAIDKQKVGYRESFLNCVRFCSMVPMRALPAKVIVLLGMNEGEFPRQDRTISLNKLTRSSLSDYCPSQTDFDRYLFLEILLSARKYFIISYVGYTKSDGKEQPPSLLIDELIQYLDESYTVAGKKPSDSCVIKHPFQPYDRRYFEGRYRSYSKKHFQEAVSFYQARKKKEHRFLSEFEFKGKFEPENGIVVDIKSLAVAARNPIKSYFNERLGIYLEREEDKTIKIEEPFSVSNLEKSIISKASLKKPLSHVLNLSRKTGKLPFGLFYTLATDTISRSVNEMNKNLEQLGVKKEELFEIEFTDQVEIPEKSVSGDLKFPPLEINFKEGVSVKIIGKLSDVSPQGLLAHIKDEKSDVIKIWPQYLIYVLASEKYRLSDDPKLIFAKSGIAKSPFFQNAEPLLVHFLEYYFLSLENASPLIPEWISDILKNDPESFEKKMKSNVSDRNKFFFNDYVLWSLSEKNIPEAKAMLENWNPVAEILFSPIYAGWYSKKGDIEES